MPDAFPFIPLTNCSQYSLQHSVIRVPELLGRCAELNYPACGFCDVMNVFGAVQFQTQALKHGIKPLFGATLQIRSHHPKSPQVTLLCADADGYHHLCQLLSRAYREPPAELTGFFSQVATDWLTPESCAGLIMVTDPISCFAGAMPDAELDRQIDHWKACFQDRLYLGITRFGHTEENACNHRTLTCATHHNLPVVATHPVRFLSSDDFQAHRVKYCIQQGFLLANCDHDDHFTREQFLPEPSAVAKKFSDIPQALANSIEIAKRCNFLLPTGTNYLPEFPVEPGTTIDEALAAAAEEGLKKHLEGIPDDKHADYHNRLEIELEVIHKMGFSGYFMIVADFIQWAKSQRIPVGPGRGSGAGSLVAFSLSITDLDPITNGLLFERFLNPERVSMPDFDIDFCMAGRDRVIDYVAERYGRDSVAQIITFGTLAAKAVVRDVGRVLGHPYGFVDQIARLIPNQLGITLREAVNQEEELRNRYHNEDEVKELIDISLKLEGLVRNVGKHAGGVVIAPKAMEHFTPIYIDPENQSVVTQFDKDDVEKIGLVKFDFLGLRTLTIVDQAVQNVRKAFPDKKLSIHRIPLDDRNTFRLLCSGMTTAVFQLESYGMQALLKRLHPDCFEDIVALVALYRPGPLQSGMVDDFIERKHGRSTINYPHPCLEQILKPTYGVILYQEQVMQIAQELSGYTLGGADILRRAMGKKKPEEMARQRSIFASGAVERGHDAGLANNIFDLIEKFAGYGFNKSHSVAYALLTYQTAWLKAHFPAHFMASVLSADLDNTDKLAHLIQDCRQSKLEILPPCINESDVTFTVTADNKKIRYGLAALKGVGRGLAQDIVSKRGDEPYKDLLDLCQRLDRTSLNRRALEALCRSGAFDTLRPNRASALASIDRALKMAERCHADQQAGQLDLFAQSTVHATTAFDWVETKPWSPTEQLAQELDSIGLYLSGHPMKHYRQEVSAVKAIPLTDWRRSKRGQSGMIAGIITDHRSALSRHGGRLFMVNLEDETGSLELFVYPENVDRYRHLIAKNRIILAQVNSQVDSRSERVRHTVEALYSIQDIRQQYQPRIQIVIDEKTWRRDQTEELKALLGERTGGNHPVSLLYRRANGSQEVIPFAQTQLFHFDEMLVQQLSEMTGVLSCHLKY